MEVLKYLSDGSPIILVGPASDRTLENGETLAQVEICRLNTEVVEATQVHDEKPDPPAAPGTTPTVTAPAPVVATKADQLASLHTAGVLSDDEYAAAQARL